MVRGPYFLIILLFAALAALGQFSTNIYIPSLPEIESELQTTKQLTQLSITIFLGVFAICQLFYGPISDRYGRIKIIVAGTLIYIVGSFICATASNINFLIAGRAVQAVGAAGGVIVGRALLRDLYSGPRLDQTISTMNAVFAIVPAISPVAGAYLAAQFNWRADFWAAVVLGVLVIPWLLWSVSERTDNRIDRLDGSRLITLYKDKFENGYFLRLALASGILYGGMFAYFSESPDLFQVRFGVSAQAYSWIVAATVGAFVAGNVSVGFFRKHFEVFPLLKLAFVLCAICSIVLLMSFYMSSGFSWLFVGILAVFLFGTGIVMPLSISSILQAFPKTAGTASSTMGFIHMGSGTVGSLLVIGLNKLGVLTLPAAMTLLSVAAFAIFMLLKRAGHMAETDGPIPVAGPPFFSDEKSKR